MTHVPPVRAAQPSPEPAGPGPGSDPSGPASAGPAGSVDVANSADVPHPAGAAGSEHPAGAAGSEHPAGAAAPAGWPARLRASVRLAAPAIGLYLLLRAISLYVMSVLAFAAHRQEPDRQVYWDGSHDEWRGFTSALDALLSWDARWYVTLTGEGLGGPVGAVDPNGVPYSLRLMFFPLYTWLSKPFTYLPFVTPAGACLIVSLLSAVAAAWGLFRIGHQLHGKRFGTMLAAIWAVVPAAMTQNGAFTESLFTAFAAWTLLAVLNQQWLTAGLLAGLSGLSRPTAAALIGTVGLAALIAAVRRRDGWRPYAAMLLAPIGLLGYVGYASSRLGGVGAYFEVHRNTFGAHFDYGESTWEVVKGMVVGVGDNAGNPMRMISLLFLFGFLGFMILTFADRAPWPLLVFSAATIVLALGSRAHISMVARHLLPVFPVLLVPAAALAKASNRTATIVLVTLAICSGWYGGWLPFISGQAI